MKEAKLISLLGLAQKAGKLVTGEFAVEKAVKAGKAKMVLIAADASANTKDRFRSMTAFYQVAHYEVASKEQLGSATGKMHRASVAVLDVGFCDAIKRMIEKTDQ
ncbi:ribosomal protein l7ae/l30e/s12e/gadd45 [Lucifera butyrica]|uniref:Ribosomal protein l7ae/l30e/s12e/gadd45 n=1 Tax=Lucifera butyrica TaxID=1351585 RepID=A0A498RA68_9FIRM|nr:ribosomal L7Ae/L30e/S12e/Gadd45 family protein [Lucifera butyrica]VBB08049.1 ribosomal protein l7ae/l30e/s12e/gadd45 [Lucifera butyrica]